MVKVNGHILVAPVDRGAMETELSKWEIARKTERKKGGYIDRKSGADSPEIRLMKIISERPDLQKLLDDAKHEKWCQFVEDFKHKGLEYAVREFDPDSEDWINE